MPSRKPLVSTAIPRLNTRDSVIHSPSSQPTKRSTARLPYKLKRAARPSARRDEEPKERRDGLTFLNMPPGACGTLQQSASMGEQSEQSTFVNCVMEAPLT